MSDCRIVTSDLPRRSWSARSPTRSFSTPVGSPTGTATASGRDYYDDHWEDDEDKENILSAQERLLRSPTDKLLSPVSRALKAHKRSPKRGVRTSLTSLLDAAV